jgi:hypothetical protein
MPTIEIGQLAWPLSRTYGSLFFLHSLDSISHVIDRACSSNSFTFFFFELFVRHQGKHLMVASMTPTKEQRNY